MSYTELSSIYDAFMGDGPHEQWLTWFQENVLNLQNMQIADVGCGTGKLTVALAPLCQSIVGVDLSDDMLTQAQERALEERVHVTWLMQDMRQLRLPQPVDAVVSSCDSLNYLLNVEELREAFSRIYDSVKPSGRFCFDVLGPKRLELLRGGFWYDLQTEAAVLYETDVESTGRIVYDVNAFVEEAGGLYRRFEEHHVQQFFSHQTVRSALESCGFVCQQILGDFGQTSLEEADRLIFFSYRRD